MTRTDPPSLDANRLSPAAHPKQHWRCTRCDKLLGVQQDGCLHLRFAHRHEYVVGFPVVATCRGCGTLNQAAAPTR